ncbi:hotdog fold thioesterase [Chitinophaga sp. sic0106]|uniref:hotdog fold thioesterase n=1 Tax=Chitinophaga sp. sic0106 TaxID=2854785 RepID=UPI001C48AC06|nr:hotdog fold thioesterase [Chitinophaga sp. sic0106]MBV7529616.1 hotdog fold thioesterase [Chitinophaga sp. sic0106]
MITDSIWYKPVSIATLNEENAGTLNAHLGMEFTEIGPDFLTASMPVDHRTVQKYGILHGGASMALAETVGSIAGTLVIDPDLFVCFGMEINANHIRSARSGRVYATARALHLGGRTQVWDIRIQDESGQLICICRHTVAVVAKIR